MPILSKVPQPNTTENFATIAQANDSKQDKQKSKHALKKPIRNDLHIKDKQTYQRLIKTARRSKIGGYNGKGESDKPLP